MSPACLSAPTPESQHCQALSPSCCSNCPPGSAIARASQGSSQPPLSSFSHLWIQPMFVGALNKHQALCYMLGLQREQRGSCPCHPRAQSGWHQPPPHLQACLMFQPPNKSAHHPLGSLPQRSPLPSSMDLAHNDVTMVPILHQAGGSGTQEEYPQRGD